jgi:RHH-type proline utilization regulon transcriptional repressor/proline dehydrogenase/delta 1-pyrroline-5-carboxylate dehydrogenase
MRLLGHQFVLGETISEALSRARGARREGYRHSFDMLGEGARTAADAERYFQSYAKAIEAIGRAAEGSLPDRPGISSSCRRCIPAIRRVRATGFCAS